MILEAAKVALNYLHFCVTTVTQKLQSQFLFFKWNFNQSNTILVKFQFDQSSPKNVVVNFTRQMELEADDDDLDLDTGGGEKGERKRKLSGDDHSGED